MHSVPRALAAVAEKHGVTLRYDTLVTRLETLAGRAVAVHTAHGERLTADAMVLNGDLPTDRAGERDSRPVGRLAPAARSHCRTPSCVIMHLGTRAKYRRIAHHNVHFGGAWHRTFDEVVNRGELMSDPSLLVTNPTATDPSLAPAGRHSYYVLAPVPNLRTAPVNWDGPVGRRYAGELMATLEARGYLDLGAKLELSYVVTPDDWARQGAPDGTPFAGAGGHGSNITRTGDLHPVLSNVVFIGSGSRPGVGVPAVLNSGKLAAYRVVGHTRHATGDREGSRVG
jgi:phytoene desaturase